MIKSTFFVVLSLLTLMIFSGCSQDSKSVNHLDGKALLQSKCASCHNLEMPPKTSADELAPPMMAVAFHVYDFIDMSTPAEKVPASIAFVRDYVVSPSQKKSFCDAKSLNEYGLMPSQKGNLTDDELEAIAIYMFEHYNQENFLDIMKQRRILRDMHSGERVARKYKCMSCHGIAKRKMGPSFSAIAERYKKDEVAIKKSIRLGSKDKWTASRHARMPAFKQLTNDELDTVSKWIKEQ